MPASLKCDLKYQLEQNKELWDYFRMSHRKLKKLHVYPIKVLKKYDLL